MGAPVGTLSSTSLIDNNTSTNNPNNTPFNIGMLKDASGNQVQFTNAYHEDGKISTYWLYKYQNGVSYYHWSGLNTNTALQSGLGYTQKGGGTLSEYIFEGKPNNGTILLSATDTGGDGSVGGVSKTQYLVGNPYPSAIDTHQFIEDNETLLGGGGAIYLWEQWAGDSHVLNAYEGGYATRNKFAGTRAYQFIGLNGGQTADQSGTKTPQRYLPVGQGFMVEVVGTGNLQFNNGQRKFQKEDPSQSIFFKTTNENATVETTSEEELIQKIRLELVANNGLGRELVLGFSDATTDGFDYGYDAKVFEVFTNDLTLPLGTEQMVIQAYGSITPEKVVDLNFKSDGNLTYTIAVSEFENFPADQEMYLLDNLTGTYHDLTSATPYSFTSTAGTFNDRFDIVFKNAEALSNEDFELETQNTSIFYQNTQALLFVKGLESKVKTVQLYNTLGQEVYNNKSLTNQQLESGISISNLSTGMYIVSITTTNNQSIDKKIIIE